MCDDDVNPGVIDPLPALRPSGVATIAAAGGSSGGAGGVHAIEREVAITTADGEADAVLHLPAGNGPWPGILVWTDILGLRPVFRDMGRRLAAEGYVVLTPNPYYRIRKGPIVEAPVNLANPTERAALFGFMQSLTAETTAVDAPAFFTYLDALPEVDKSAGLGVHGYCMGGRLMMRSAAAAPGRVRAGASFHGAGLVTDQTDSPHLQVPKLKGEYLILIAADDDDKQPEAKETLRQAFTEAGVRATIEVYAGANHGWCVRGHSVYNHDAAERAWSELLDLYKRALA